MRGSEDERLALIKQKETAPLVPIYLTTCCMCGTRFSSYFRNQISCSPQCAYQRNIVTATNAVHRRRARMSPLQNVKFNIADLLDRDNYTCSLCGGSIQTDLPKRHPMSPSMDHVQPISKGGAHTWDNLQAAHLRCNMSKGALNKTPFSSVGSPEPRAPGLEAASAKRQAENRNERPNG